MGKTGGTPRETSRLDWYRGEGGRNRVNDLMRGCCRVTGVILLLEGSRAFRGEEKTEVGCGTRENTEVGVTEKEDLDRK